MRRRNGRRGWSFNTVAVVAIVSLSGGIAAAVGIPVKVFWDLKFNEAYRQGMDIAREDPAVVRMFGAPVKDGFFVDGDIVGRGHGHKFSSLQGSISGPRGHGILRVDGEKPEDGPWRLLNMYIYVGHKGVLTWDCQHPERGFQP